MSILENIGNTPLLKLKKVTKGLDAEIFFKCEYLKMAVEHGYGSIAIDKHIVKKISI